MHKVPALAIAGVSIAVAVGVGGLAAAAPPTGTCTDSYTPYTEEQLVAIDPAVASIFGVIDTNGNGVICFKPYPNGPHHGHGGNLVDDKSAPHS